MCGIAGIVSHHRVNESLVRRMNDLQQHRGPDGEGIWTSHGGACVLGHRRLSILDLTDAGKQPMVEPSQGIAITFNGEIYNYVELRERLRGLGHSFKTQTDTEVLLRAYIEWGEAALNELNGMFAFALWDEKKKRLFCARDRFGEKPFVYAWTHDGTFVFASEVKALSACRGVDLSIDDGVLASYANHGPTWIEASERTLLRGVKQLLPAHAMLIEMRNGRPEVCRTWSYWGIDVSARHSFGADNPAQAANSLLDLLHDSVRLRLRSDVRVGSCLSGGLDSSAIVALMGKLDANANFNTFTGRFPGHAMDEGHYADAVVKASRTTHHEVSPSAERFIRDSERLYWHADFPVGGMSQFAQWCVFHLASEHGVTVLLDGQGSDEQLGGYGGSITAAYLSQLISEKRLAAWLQERRQSAQSAPWLFSWPRLATQHFPWKAPLAFAKRITNRPTLSRRDLFAEDWLQAATPNEPVPEAANAIEGSHALSRMLWMLTFRTMLSSLLRFGDRLSMAHSREVRLPFCDHRIAEFAFGLSPELLVGNGEVKRVLRLAIRGLVPDVIVNRPKQGFVPPERTWLEGPLKNWIEQLVEHPAELEARFDMKVVRGIAHSRGDARKRDSALLWDIANVFAWQNFSLKRMKNVALQAHQKEPAFVEGAFSIV